MKAKKKGDGNEPIDPQSPKPIDVPDEAIEPSVIPPIVERLTKDIKNAASTLTKDEARYLVDAYYAMQDARIRSAGQVRSMQKDGESCRVITWFADQNLAIEASVNKILDFWTRDKPVAVWARSQCGIGPIISAGLEAHIDIHKAPHVGHIYRFAGLAPGVRWEKGTKRPWNAELKTLCWKIGESFVKVCNNDRAFYGKVYMKRKEMEWERNFRGELADQCDEKLDRFKIGDDTSAVHWYNGSLTVEVAKELLLLDAMARIAATKKRAGKPGSGVKMLPPAHIHSRAKRYAVKLFLSHWHEVAHWEAFGKAPPPPFPIGHLGHVDIIPVPNFTPPNQLVEA